MNGNVYKKGERPEYLEVKTRLGVEKIELKKVLYFMSDVRVVEAHMQRGETFRFYEKLDIVQEQLDSDEWLRCHKSYLVNRKWIRQITRESLMIGKETIPVSRNYYMQLRDKGLIGRDKDKMEMTLAPNRKDVGVVRCVGGKYEGMEYYIYPNEKLVLGRGYDRADLIFDEPQISRVHCWIQYNQTTNHYYISNQSTNGIYIGEDKVEEKDVILEVKKGTRIRLANTEQVFEIG